MIDKATIKSLSSPRAVGTFARKHYGGDYEALIQAINKSINSLLGKDLNLARELAQSAEACFAAMPEKFGPYLLAIKARLDHHAGNHKDALGKYENAYSLHKKYANHEAAARLGQGLMDVLMYLGRYQQALAVGKRSLAWFRRQNREEHAARVMTNIGLVYHRLDKNRLALQWFDKARDIFSGRNELALATVEFNRANIYANMNQLPEAASLYRAAAEIYRKAGLDVFYNKAIYSIAYLEFLGDNYTEALRIFEKVYEAFSRLGDRKAVAVTRLDLVEINIHLNQFGTAIIHGHEVIEEFKDLGMRYEHAKAQYFVALAHLHLGDLRQAGSALRNAKRLFAQERNDLWLGMVALARAKVQIQAGRAEMAAKTSDEARELFDRSQDRRRGTDAEIVHLEALWLAGRPDLARRIGRRLLKRKLVSYQAYHIHTALGRMLVDDKRYKKALIEFQAAVEVVERMLAGLYPDEIRFFFAADKLTAYHGVVECLLALGRYEDSFAGNLRALTTLNRRQIPTEELQSQIPEKLIKERDRLRAALKRLGGFPQAGHRGLRSEHLTETEQQLWSTEQRIRARLYSKPAATLSPATELERIQANLGSDDMLVSFVIPGEASLGAFCLTADNLRFVPLEISLEALRRTVWELYFVLERAVFDHRQRRHGAEATEYYLQQLAAHLLKPVLREVSREKIIILADGIFAQIPYPALLDSDGGPLRRAHDFRLIVNPDDLAAQHSTDTKFSRADNSIFAVLSERLPEVESEARGIKDIFGDSTLYANGTANSSSFKTELERTDGFIHIATHASRSSENPLFSRISLSDGPFYPFDLFNAGIKAQLVTLSGCQTAASGLYYGHSFNLAKAFYQSGSRHVLASLWPISDTVSKSFMLRFYISLRKSNSVAGAYREAVDATADEIGNPALWSAFVLLGM